MWQSLLWTALFCWSLWWLLAGSVRFLLLIIGGSSALQTLQDFLKEKNAPLRPATGSNTGLWSRPGNIFEKVSAQLRDEIAGIPQYWRNFGRNFIPSVRREFFDDEPKSRFQKVLGWVWLVAFVAFLVCVNTPSIRRSWGMPEEATSAPTPALSHVPAGTPSSTPHHAKHHHSTE
jgi:hypothetical protein